MDMQVCMYIYIYILYYKLARLYMGDDNPPQGLTIIIIYIFYNIFRNLYYLVYSESDAFDSVGILL